MLAWSRDGQQLASLNWDGSISIWSAAPQLPGPTERWKEAGARVFAWHLAEAEAAVNQAQTRAAEFHVNRLRDETPPDIVTLLRRARLSLLLGNWDRAATDYARWFDAGEPDDGPAWLNYARLLIARGDYDRYRRLCKRLIDAFEQQVNPQMAFCAAQTIGLAPGPPIQARKVISLVDRAIPLERRHAEIDFALALVYLRVEEFDRAAILLHKFTDREPDRAWRSWPVLAIIDRRLGRMEELKRDLAKARAWRDRHKEDVSAGTISAPLSPEWLDFEAFYREAATQSDPVK